MSTKQARWAALLCAVFLMMTFPFAHAFGESSPGDAEALALKMINQVYYTTDPEEQKLLLLQAVQAAPDSPFVLMECAGLLSILNNDGKLTSTIEQLLLSGKELATGELSAYFLRALGDHYLQTQSLDAAKDFVEQELEKTPKDHTLLIMLAKIYYFAGQLEEAKEVLSSLVNDQPQSLEAANLLAVLLTELERWDEALSAYDHIEEQFPEYPEGLNGRYLAYIAMGEFELAVRAINEEIYATREEYLWMVRINVRLFKQHDPEGALDEAVALIKAHPDWLDAHVAKMDALIMLDRFEEAMEAAREVSDLDAELSGALEGLVLMSFSRWEEAKDLILSAVSVPRLQSIWSDAARLYLDGYDDTDAATDAIVKSFAVEDNQYLSFLRLGDLNARLGNLLEAARCYYRAEQYAQSDANGMYMLVATLADAGRKDDTEKYLLKMEERYPGWFETMLARVIYEDVFNMPEQAAESFAAMKEKFPYPASTMQSAEAVLLLAAGDVKGEEMIKAWINQQDPESLTIADWFQYAQALQYTDNIETLNEALSIAESLINQMDPARVNEIRQYQSQLYSYRASVASVTGDMEACVQWLAKACEFGATLLSDTLLMADGTPYVSQTYDELYRQYGPDEEPWDITVLPVIPK